MRWRVGEHQNGQAPRPVSSVPSLWAFPEHGRHAPLGYWAKGLRMNILEQYLIWLFAPTLVVIVIACILSLTPLKPPKNRGTSWFKTRDW